MNHNEKTLALQSGGLLFLFLNRPCERHGLAGFVGEDEGGGGQGIDSQFVALFERFYQLIFTTIDGDFNEASEKVGHTGLIIHGFLNLIGKFYLFDLQLELVGIIIDLDEVVSSFVQTGKIDGHDDKAQLGILMTDQELHVER